MVMTGSEFTMAGGPGSEPEKGRVQEEAVESQLTQLRAMTKARGQEWSMGLRGGLDSGIVM